MLQQQRKETRVWNMDFSCDSLHEDCIKGKMGGGLMENDRRGLMNAMDI